MLFPWEWKVIYPAIFHTGSFKYSLILFLIEKRKTNQLEHRKFEFRCGSHRELLRVARFPSLQLPKGYCGWGDGTSRGRGGKGCGRSRELGSRSRISPPGGCKARSLGHARTRMCSARGSQPAKAAPRLAARRRIAFTGGHCAGVTFSSHDAARRESWNALGGSLT